MSFQLGNAYGKVTLDASGVKAGVSQASSSLESLGAIGEKIGNVLTGAGQAMTVGLTLPIVAFGVASVKAAADSESAIAELNAVLKSTGGIAGVTAQSVMDYAKAMQKVTVFDDEAIIGGQSMLLTFTKIGKDVFPAASTAMLNMAQKFGSIKEASIQLGKALNDPVAGVSALRRVGVMLSDQQEQQITDFMAVNDIASAQKVILKELETEFGGLAEAVGKTPEGKWAEFLNKMGDVGEVVGNYLLPTLLKILDVLSALADAFLAAPEWLQGAIINFGMLLAALGPVLMILGQLIVTVSTVAGAWSSIATILPGLTTALAALGPALAGIGATITGTLLPAIASVIIALLPIIVTIALIAAAFGLLYWAWTTDFLGFQTTLKQLGFIIQYYFKQGMDGAVKAVQDAAPVIQKGWQDMTTDMGNNWNNFTKLYVDLWQLSWKTVINVLSFGVGSVMNYFAQLRDNIFAFFQQDWSQLGMNIIDGMIAGIISKIGALIDAVKQAGQTAFNAMQDALDGHSPSKKFDYLGKMSGLGYINGLARSLDPAVMTRTMSNATQPVAANTSNQIVQNFATGLTLRDVQRLLDERDQMLFNQLGQAFGS